MYADLFEWAGLFKVETVLEPWETIQETIQSRSVYSKIRDYWYYNYKYIPASLTNAYVKWGTSVGRGCWSTLEFIKTIHS